MIKTFIKNHFFAGFLIAFCALIAVLNYQPGTFLSGWDNLHPEFNSLEYIKRIIFGAYQPNQGLGAASSQSHAAEIPRMLLYIPLSLVLPLSFVRYSYFFLMMILGPLGMYYLLKHKAFLKTSPLIIKELVSTLGAILYLLNLGTLQHFYTPLEMFPTLFASLPWVFLSAICFLETQTKRNLFFFAIATIFVTPAAHTATLWYAYFFCFLLYLAILSLLKPRLWSKITLLVITTIILNLYWLLPSIYFTVNHGGEVQNSKIHSLFTEEAFAKNLEFANLADLALLKSFPFDWGKYAANSNGFVPLMDIWIRHLNNPIVPILGYAFFALALIGVLFSLVSKRVYAIGFVGVAILCTFFLLATNSPLGFLFSFLQEHFPLFREAFRFPFTKFSLPFIFCYSFFFAYGLEFLLNKLSKLPVRGKEIFVCVFVFLSICFFMLPAFSGNFISPSMKVVIPQEYFDLFAWFQKNPKQGRIATLPIQSFWGWNYYSWGYQGAGFLWFGINKPILEREFDRWSPFNEQYFQEMSYAVYTKNEKLLKNVIEKYDIGFLLLDKSIITPGANPKILFYEELSNLLQRLESEEFLSHPVQFGAYLFVYEVKKEKSYPISSLEKTFLIKPKENSYYEDFVYNFYQDYIIDLNNTLKGSYIYYPMKNIIDNLARINKTKLSIHQDSIELNLPPDTGPYHFMGFSSLPSTIPTDIIIEKQKEKFLLSLYPNMPIFDAQPSVAPLRGEFSIPSSESTENDFQLSVNNQLLTIPRLENKTPLAIGKAFLASSNHIALYSLGKKDSFLPLLKNANLFFSYCDAVYDVKKALKVFIKRDQVQIVKEPYNSLCISIPLEFLNTSQTGGGEQNQSQKVVSISFLHKGRSKLSACIKNSVDTTCSRFTKVQEQGPEKLISFTTEKEKSDSQLIIEFDPNGATPTETISQLQYKESLSLNEVELAPEIIYNSFLSHTIDSFREVTIAKNIFSDYSRNITEEKRFTNDCRLKSSEQYSSKKPVSAAGGNAIKYVSTKGSFCDHFSYEHLPHSLAYLVFIESKNEQGLPLNLCITNYDSGRCDIYAKLGTFNDFNTDIFLLPASGVNSGYDLNFENVGIKGTPAINYVRSITFVPLPFNIFERIYTVKQGIQNSTFEKGTVQTVKQYNPLLFQVTTNGKPTLLALSYSYEPGFKAYAVPCELAFTCALKTIGAPLFGKEIREHVLVNNWANGWVVDGSKFKVQSFGKLRIDPERSRTGQSSRLIIVYLPQYLEYFGFTLIGIYILLLITGLYIPKIMGVRMPAQHSYPHYMP